MGKLESDKLRDFLTERSDVIKADIIAKLKIAAQDNIKQKVNKLSGQILESEQPSPTSFIVGIKKPPDDPTGAKLVAAEMSDLAFSSTFEMLKNKKIVTGIINKE